ncbi:proline racemase family protein [Roseimaritima ulvae]|nr:proline racemase family protein [Roseimaritima ulvae]
MQTPPANPFNLRAIDAIDTHTGGEPTRIVFAGGPDLGQGPMLQRMHSLRRDADWLRTALILEPRGSAWIVGALLQPSCDPDCAAGVIFFNNRGYIGMCGHGLIGVVAALAYRGRIQPGTHRFETVVGEVTATLHDDQSVSIKNVASYRWREQVSVQVPGEGTVCGDIAYGGNWFFLVDTPGVDPAELESLSARCRRIHAALRDQGIVGADGSEIDHIELFGPPSDPQLADGRNFVLCPGGEYDRSPCGTGTSAKLACLAAAGKLQVGEVWRQESIIGSVFAGRYTPAPQGPVEHAVIPTITGRAFVTAETRFVLDPQDPLRLGIPTIKDAAAE